MIRIGYELQKLYKMSKSVFMLLFMVYWMDVNAKTRTIKKSQMNEGQKQKHICHVPQLNKQDSDS